MSSVGDWFDKALCWISSHSYQIIESNFSQKFYYASFRDCLKEGLQWVNSCSTHHDSVATLYIPGVCAQLSVWPQCWQAVGGPWDKIWDFVTLEWPICSRVITTSSALVMCRNLLGGTSVGFRRYRSLPCIDTSHLIWTSCWM